jgi:fibronectin-binding autotransporter adhesin
VTVNHTGPESGSVVLAGLGTINFSEIEPLTLGGDAADLVINLPAGPNTATVLSDDGGATDPDGTNDAGMSAIYDSTSPYAFEYTQFKNPTNSLTINAAGGDDVVTIQTLDADFAVPTLIFTGAAVDNTTATGSVLTVASGNFTGTVTDSGTGTLGLTKVTGDTLTLSGTGITFQGNVDVQQGTLTLQDATNFAKGAPAQAQTLTTASGATLEFNVTSGTHAIGLNVTGGLTINGNGTLKKSGGGLLALDEQGSSSFAVNLAMTGGTIDIQGGTLRNGGWQGQDWTNNKASLNVAGGAFFDVWDGSPVYVDALTGAGSVIRTQGGVGQTLRIGMNGGSGTFSGVISNATSTTAVIKEGAGTQVFSGPNTYTGSTTINAGTIQLSGADNRLPTGGGVTIANTAGAVLDLNGLNQEIRWLTGGGATGGSVVNAGAAATLTINLGASGNRTYDGTITGNIGVVVKNSTTKNTDFQAFTWTNSYNGKTVIDNGHLRVNADGALGALPGALDATNLTLQNGGVLRNSSAFVMLANRGVFLGTGGGVFDVNTFLTINGPVSGPGSLTKTENSTLGLMGVNSYSGKTIVNAGILSINSDASLGAVPGSLQTDNLTLNGGTLCNMTTTTSFTGGNNITLNANRGITLGASGGTIRLGYSQPMTIPGPITGGALTLTDNGSLTLTGTNSYTTTNIAGTANSGQRLQIGNGGTTGTLGTGAVTIARTLSLVVNRSNALAVANDIGGAGTLSVDVIADTGTSRIGYPGSGGSGYLALANGTLQYTGTGANSTTRYVWIDQNPGTFDIAQASGTLTLSPTGGTRNKTVTKLGAGTLALGAGTWSGQLNVNAGTVLDDTTVSGNVIVNNAAVFGGTGTASGSVTLASGSTSTLSPGSPVTATADLATGSLTLSSGTTLAVQVNGLTPDTQHDQLIVTGGVNLGGAMLDTTGSTITASLGDKVVLIANDLGDNITTAFPGQPDGSTVTVNGQDFRVFYNGHDGNDVVLIRAGSGGTVATVFVNEDWAGLIPGNDPDGTGPAEAYLVDAYATIQAAIDNVTDGGTIYVLGNDGSYAGFNLNKNVQIRFITDYQNAGETTVTLNSAVTLSQNADWVLFDGSIVGAEATTVVAPANLTTTAAGTIHGAATNTQSLSLTSTTDGTGAVTLHGVIGGSQTLSSATIGQAGNRVASIDLNDLRAGGTVSLATSGAISQDVVDAAADVTAASLVAAAVSGIDLDTTVTNLTATNSGSGNINLDESDGTNVLNVAADGGNATVTTATGNLAMTTVSAGGTVTLTATAGVITDANAGGNNVTAARAVLTATGGIDLDTAIGSLQATNSGSGDINLNNSSALVIAGISQSGGGNLVLVNAGAISQSGAITVSGNGTASFSAGANAITLTHLSNDFTGAVSLDNSGGNAVAIRDQNALTLGACTIVGQFNADAHGLTVAGLVTVTGWTFLTSTGAGDVRINAPLDVFAISVLEVNSDDDFVINSPVVATNAMYLSAGRDGSGSVHATSSGSLFQNVAGNPPFTIKAGASSGTILFEGWVRATDALGLSANGATGGTVSQTATGTVIAPRLGISARHGITLDVCSANQVGELGFSASNSTDGDVRLANTGPLMVTGITHAGTGSIDVRSTGSVSVTGTVLTAAGQIALTATDGATTGQDLTVTGTGAVQASGSSVTLSAGDDFTLAAGGSVSAATTVTVNIDAGNADSGTGAAAVLDGPITSGGGATLNGNADADTVTVNRR